jgi:hypothetical protein
MAQKKITQLDPATFATFADLYPIVQGGNTLKITHHLLAALLMAMFQDNDGITWTYDDVLHTMTPNVTIPDDGAEIAISKIGAATYDSVQDFINLISSSGITSGGAITDAGGGTINVAAGTGFIRIADTDVAELKSFDFAASAGIVIPANTTRYIGVEYNAGAPQITVRTTSVFDLDTEFPLGTVVNEAGTLHIINRPWHTYDAISNIIERFDAIIAVQRDNRIPGGVILSGTGTRNVALTAGQLMGRLEEYPITAKDTSVSGSFESYHRDGLGGFTNTSGLTQWPNDKYDDNSGVLATMTNDYFASLWFYVTTDDKVVFQYGRAEYATVGELQQADAPPTTFPARLSQMALLVGRIIFQKGASSPFSVQTVFANQLTLGSVTDHGNLSGLADDDHLQYFNTARANAWLPGAIAARRFTSSQQVITAAGALTLPHGLGSTPFRWGAYLVNLTAELGYTTGQVAWVDIAAMTSDRGVQIRPDATNLNIRFGAAAVTFMVFNQTTGAMTNITNANWRIVFTAEL